MTWSSLDTWIVVIGVLTAVPCAGLGCFLILRRMSMMGDAISHAVLPGLAVAFLLTQSRVGPAMFIGAAVVGTLTAVLTQAIHRWARVDMSAAMGVVFTTLFALGLILIVRAADTVDLDPGCVLYGAIEYAPLYTSEWLESGLGVSIPRAAVVMGMMLLVDMAFITLLFKELRLTCFDPALADTLGLRSGVVHYALMILVAATAVAAFEAVGSILVVAMLIVPGATAHLLTDRLGVMVGLSAVIAAGCAALGHVAAITVPMWFGYRDTSTAGMMVVVGGVVFSLVALLAPRYGVLSRLITRAVLALRIVREDVLGFLYRLEELARSGPPLTTALVAEAVGATRVSVSVALWQLRRAGAIEGDRVAGVRLTGRGRHEATHLVRTHRLWETYLARHFQLPLDHLHAPAMTLEHVTDEAMRRGLAEATDEPVFDPHGKRVPK